MKLPLRIKRHENSYQILDADDRSVCFVYYENEESRRDLLKMMTSSEAEIIIKKIARALSGSEDAEKSRPIPKDRPAE